RSSFCVAAMGRDGAKRPAASITRDEAPMRRTLELMEFRLLRRGREHRLERRQRSRPRREWLAALLLRACCLRTALGMISPRRAERTGAANGFRGGSDRAIGNKNVVAATRMSSPRRECRHRDENVVTATRTSSRRRELRGIRDDVSERGDDRGHDDDKRRVAREIRPEFRQNLPTIACNVADFRANDAKLTRFSRT